MWSDRDTDQDFLGYSSYVNVLAETCTMKDLAPLTLGIFGPWGSGKTSLMRMLQVKVDAAAPAVKAKTLWFNAWRYEGRDEAQSALIHAVLAKLAEDRTLWQDAKDTFEKLKKGASVLKLAKFIGKSVFTMTPKIDEFIDCFKEESEKIAETMEAFDKDFEGLLAKAKIERIVVFIDDLDRCSSGKVIETFETIKLFLNTPPSTHLSSSPGSARSARERHTRNSWPPSPTSSRNSVPSRASCATRSCTRARPTCCGDYRRRWCHWSSGQFRVRGRRDTRISEFCTAGTACPASTAAPP